MSWQDAGDPDNGPRNSRDYYVELWHVGGSWAVNSGWRLETNWSVNLPVQGTYAWRVKSGDGSEASAWSSEYRFVSNQPPNPPVNLRPVHGSQTGASTVTLSWQDAGDPDNGPRTSRDYYLEIWQVGGSWSAAPGWRFETSWSVNLPGTGTYAWRVKSGDGIAASAWSAEHRFVVDAPAAPSSLRVASRTPSSITLAWQDRASTETGYRVYRWNGNTQIWDVIATLGPNATSYTDTGLNYRLGYSYWVGAFNAWGQRITPAPVDGFIAIAHSDLNNNRTSDIIWRHQIAGRNVVFLMQGATIATFREINQVSNLDWKVAGSGDFNGDGRADTLWRNTRTGQNVIHFMNGTQISGSGTVNVVSDLNWRVAGVADFNGDGRADILWRNTRTGANVVYLMDGMRIIQSVGINVVPDLAWHIVAVDDFNADGRADILWRNTRTGANHMYIMEGGRLLHSVAVHVIPDMNWKVVGAGDYNGDGRADILWRNMRTGANVLHLMDGARRLSSISINKISDLNWKIVGSGDYNGDGRSDILWRNLRTGVNHLYMMNGARIALSAQVNQVTDLKWQVVGRASNTLSSANHGLAFYELGEEDASAALDGYDIGSVPLAMEMTDDEIMVTLETDPSAMVELDASSAPMMESADGTGMLGPNDEPASEPEPGIVPLPLASLTDQPESVPFEELSNWYGTYLPLIQR